MGETDEQVDKISHLPDTLLSEILSYMSTKEAVATSILSKRWEYIWTKVPVLNFTVDSNKSANGFKAFVDRVLMRNDSPSLRLFKLYNTSETLLISDSNFRNVMQRDVVKIDLSLSGGNLFSPKGTLPSWMFSSEKLTKLKLMGFKSPLWDPIHLPNLLTLRLEFIEFIDNFSFKDDLLVRLPRLQKLVIIYCQGLKYIRVSSSSLKRLTLVMNSLVVEKIAVVDVPSLEYISISDFSPEYEFGYIPSLAEAILYFDEGPPLHTLRVIDFLAKVTNLVTVTFNFSTREAALGDVELDGQNSLFPNLTHLTVNCTSFSDICSHFSWRNLVLWILRRAPNLISLDYYPTLLASSSGDKDAEIEELPRRSILPIIPALEVVNVHCLFEFQFDSVNLDKILLENLLSNAIKLKEFRINLKGVVNARIMNAIICLFEVPRASSLCELIISHKENLDEYEQYEV